MEIDDDAPWLESLLGDRCSSSPEIEVLAHNFPRTIYQDYAKPKVSSLKQPVQEVVTVKPRGRLRKQPVASSSKVQDPGPSCGRITQSRLGLLSSNMFLSLPNRKLTCLWTPTRQIHLGRLRQPFLTLPSPQNVVLEGPKAARMSRLHLSWTRILHTFESPFVRQLLINPRLMPSAVLLAA